jgi:carnitine-CoA ligase
MDERWARDIRASASQFDLPEEEVFAHLTARFGERMANSIALADAAATLPGLLQRQAERHGDRRLVRWGAKEGTVAEVRDAAARRAGALVGAGLRRGDRVVVISDNRVEVLEVWLGCAWLGAVFVPLNPALKEPQLEPLLGEVEPALVLREADLEALGEAKPIGPAEVRPDDTSAILYTSGTTGVSKGVVCPNEQWYWWARLTGDVLGIGEGDVLYTSLPLFHTNALNTFCQALLAGATYALGPRFSASRFWARCAEAGATVTYLLGPMVSILLRQPGSGDDRAHRVRIALAPATPAELHEPFRERFGVQLIDAWGSTETNIVISNRHDSNRPGTLGRVLEPFEARVAPDGELLVRSREPGAFSRGYFRREDATQEAWRGGWFHTGDRVVCDDDGVFRFVDRIKDVIRRRGENISAFEVEQVLQTHPDVAAAAVVPVPSELGEEEVLACVVVRAGAKLEPADLVAFCEERLASFAVPRYVELVGSLPLTPSGKVEKYKLRERGLTATTWDRERT